MTDWTALNKGEQEALDAVKFCLLKGSNPFRVDIRILIRIIERRVGGEQAREK